MYNFVLVGPHAGKTINLGGHQFIDGIHTLPASEKGVAPSEQDAERKGKYLAKVYQAFLEGSEELEAAQEAFDAGEPLREGVTIDDKEIPAQKTKEELEAEQAEQAAAAVEDDQTDAGKADGEGEGDNAEVEAAKQAAENKEKSPRQIDGSIRTAITKLDPKNDEHWTKAGAPSVEAVQELADNEDVSRADITRLAPKLDREEALKLAAADPLDD